jgi:uncharacterized protein YkwD
MFRKFWKTIKFFLILGIILICLPRSIFPSQTSEVEKSELEKYKKLNDSEKRLTEFKDDEEALKLKLMQLDVINISRKRNKAGPLKFDILASRVANRMCREAVENNYLGHWDLAGEKPYHRYAFAGGYDHVSENAYGKWSSASFTLSASNISSMMREGHDSFMAEKAPYDGHKKNIINRTHNFVGIGYYLSGNQFRYYEEYIDRYLEFEDIPGEVKVDEPFSITVRTQPESSLYYLVIYREKFPEPLTTRQIGNKGSYEDFTGDQFLGMGGWDLDPFRKGSVYKIPLRFPEEGLYYIQIYSGRKEVNSRSVTTKGKTPVSGIVIKVKGS